MSWLSSEPVRGSFAPPSLLCLPGIDRVMLGERGRVPAPPIHYLFGMGPVEVGRGRSVFEMPAHPWLQSSAGVFLAGVSALVADAPLGGAILSTLEPGWFGVTSELSMSFLRPANVESKVLRATANVIDVGRRLGLSEATVTDAAGRLLSHMTSRYFLRHFELLPGTEPPPLIDRIATYDTPNPWQRPLTVPVEPELLNKVGGLEYFRGVAAGEFPQSPFAELFAMRCDDASDGAATFTAPASEWFLSPARTIYGGILAFFADAAMTAAVATTLPAGSSCATLDLKAHFLRPGIADGTAMTIRGSVVHRGNTLTVARAEILNAEGKPMISATGSSMLLHGRPWQPVAVADEAGEEEPA